MSEELFKSIVEMDEEKAVEIAREIVEETGEALKVLDICKEALEVVGKKFEVGEYFLSELICAGDIFSRIMEFTLPKLKQGEVKKLGTMVLGTVKGDVHDIGKNIFKVMAEASGFEVIDIGIDVPADRFVEAVQSYKPDLVGMSCLITASVASMKEAIDALKEAGLRDKVKVIIGGGRVDEGVKQYTGADAWADDAAKGVRICKEIIGVKE